MSARRPSVADLQLVSDYLCGLRNEIAVDLRMFELAGLDPDRFGKIPRPSLWVGKVKRFPFLSRLFQYVALPAWYFLGPLLFKYQCHAVSKFRSPARKIKFDAEGQVLGFSSRAQDIVHPRNIEPVPRQWFELPWLPLKNLPSGSDVLPAMALLDEAELERSLFLATLAHRTLQRRRGMSLWGLQSYTAWRWFLTRLAVDKLPGPLLTVEHFDRWAVLADRSVRRSRSRHPTRHLTLMQHGSVNANVVPRGLGLLLPTRLLSVNHLLVYSESDAQVFKEEILSRRCNDHGVTVSLYRPYIALTDIVTPNGARSILFVGHPLCEAAHCALLASLREKGEWQVFYKPHPTSPASAHIWKQPWTVVTGRTVFPRVDLIVSYFSTMVSEYATHGIPAVVHRMDVSAQQITDRIPEILRLIESRQSVADFI